MKAILVIICMFLINKSYAQINWKPVPTNLEYYTVEPIGVLDIMKYNNQLYLGTNETGIPRILSNDTAYQTLSTCGEGFSKELIIYNNELYTGGVINCSGLYDAIAKYDGNQWTSLKRGIDHGISFPNKGYVKCLEIYNNQLFVAGKFQNVDSIPCNSIAIWDGQNWFPFGNNLSEIEFISDMATYNNELFIAGSFTNINGVQSNGIVKSNGNNIVDLNLPNYNYKSINKIMFQNDVLYVAGLFQVNNLYYSVIAYDGLNWTTVGTGSANTGYTNSMTFIDNELYIVGNFGCGIKKLANNNWQSTNCFYPEAFLDGVYNIKSVDDTIYAMGLFNSIECLYAPRLARYEASNTCGCSYFGRVNFPLCYDDSLFFNNSFIKDSGVYRDTISSFSSCDSIIELNVIVDTLPFSLPDTLKDVFCVNESSIKLGILTPIYYYIGTGIEVALEDSLPYYFFNPSISGVGVHEIKYIQKRETFYPYPSCMDTFVQTIRVENCLRIHNTFNKVLTIYPNPNTGNFYLNVNDNISIDNVIITDINSKTINFDSSLINNMIQINLKNYAVGIYYITVNSSNYIYKGKILITD